MMVGSVWLSKTTMAGVTVLCVDPDDDERVATREAFDVTETETVEAATLEAAVEALRAERVDCVVTEYHLPDGTGLDLAAELRETAPDTPLVLFTDASPSHIETGGYEDLIVEYLPKDMPESRASLVRLAGNLVEQRAQVGYPLPSDEDERLAALEQYDVSGLEAVDTFDRLTDLAARHFDVPVAFVGLVDAHEERFLACQGANWETLERENTICTHTILEDEVFVVEDTRADERFADNEELARREIRFYAGAPLRTRQGAAIGAFCLIDDEPRSFSEADRHVLEQFGDEAMEQLELRRRLADREQPTESTTGGDR